MQQCESDIVSFNTQPREGGCTNPLLLKYHSDKFQHTAARRRLRHRTLTRNASQSFNTQPLEDGCGGVNPAADPRQGFNTQPLEGGCTLHQSDQLQYQKFQHTAARRRLLEECCPGLLVAEFLHTAARRRLLPEY